MISITDLDVMHIILKLENGEEPFEPTKPFTKCTDEMYTEVAIKTERGEYIIRNTNMVEIIEGNGRRITITRQSSLYVDVLCPTLESLTDLWSQYTTGQLQQRLSDVMRVTHYRRKYKLPKLRLAVLMDEKNYLLCHKQISQGTTLLFSFTSCALREILNQLLIDC